jgi:hypothetical protein
VRDVAKEHAVLDDREGDVVQDRGVEQELVRERRGDQCRVAPLVELERRASVARAEEVEELGRDRKSWSILADQIRPRASAGSTSVKVFTPYGPAGLFGNG